MNRRRTKVFQIYQAALLSHVKKKGRGSGLELANGLGDEALAAGFQAADFAKLHEQILISHILPEYPAGRRNGIIRQAGLFFAAAIMPVDQAAQAGDRLKKSIEALSQRTVELAAANLKLSEEIAHRKAVQAELKKSEQQSLQRLRQLRNLSRQLISAQEEELKKISRELHDVIAPTLTGIGIQLDTLTKKSNNDFQSTRELVGKSIAIIHRFARELRPAVLDDLGLIPALHSFMKSFTADTGIRTTLTASAEVERLPIAKRTALFRVAQEALHNAARHAKPSHAGVSIEKSPDTISLKIVNDGELFDVGDALQATRGRHLGLLGMRERLEMIGGVLSVASTAADGTVILATIPHRSVRKKSSADGKKVKAA